MKRVRFTIASLLGLVFFVAVAFAALRRSDALWDSTLFSLTLGLLLTSVLLAIHRTEGRRAFWLGFALFGGAYLGASLIPPVEARLLTTRALAYLDSQVPGRDRSVWFARLWPSSNPPIVRATSAAISPNGTRLAVDQDRMIWLWDTETGRPLAGPIDASERFVRIGHSLTALVLAFLGARLSRALYATGPRVAEE